MESSSSSSSTTLCYIVTERSPPCVSGFLQFSTCSLFFFSISVFFFFIDAQKDFIERRSTSGTRFKIASRQKKKGGKKIKSETCADAVKWTKWPLCVAFFFCFYLCTRANDTYDVSFFFLLFVCITGLFIGY